jgi:hypothetical protein
MTDRNELIFYGEELLAARPNPKLGDRPLSAVRDCVFSISAAALPHTRTHTHTHIYIHIVCMYVCMYIYTYLPSCTNYTTAMRYLPRGNKVDSSLWVLLAPRNKFDCCFPLLLFRIVQIFHRYIWSKLWSFLYFICCNIIVIVNTRLIVKYSF